MARRLMPAQIIAAGLALALSAGGNAQALNLTDEPLYLKDVHANVDTVAHEAVAGADNSALAAATASRAAIAGTLLGALPPNRVAPVTAFISALFNVYMDAHACYLEINPLVVTARGGDGADGGANGLRLVPLDMAAKLDEAAGFLADAKWGPGLVFPPPFGRQPQPEEAYIHELDGKTGASLKLTILNRAGRVWTMVAGGGASVAYADTIADLGFGAELANYGEYSGAPSEEQTFEYARTILRLLGSGPRRAEGKVLIIGGGIANFTDVAKTFGGIIKVRWE